MSHPAQFTVPDLHGANRLAEPRRAADDRPQTRTVRTVRPPVGGGLKRGFDAAVAAVALVVLSPILLALAAAVKATSPGPVFYGHARVGWNGQAFRCLKFRTMVVEADAALERHLANDPAAAEEWAQTRKLKNDPRVTPIGKTLRRLSLDELPQFINVLRGDMSLVGPRPVVEAELERFGADVDKYLAARPGITGPWQVSGRSDVSYEERVRFDGDYVEDWSLQRDILIMIMTVPAVVRARGSY